MTNYDVIVIGGGFAGTEAAAAAARMGAKTAIVTFDENKICAMPCNPAVGGIGKGQLVREIDALDGLMARLADAAGIHFKVLNQSKGAAVQGLRAQTDISLYSMLARRELKAISNITIINGQATDVFVTAGRIRGIEVDGKILHCRAAVVTAGTFLDGKIHCGQLSSNAGRTGCGAASALGFKLAKMIPLRRLYTATPPRLKKNSIDFAALKKQLPDEKPTPFSFMNQTVDRTQIPCHIARTNKHTMEIISGSVHLSPCHNGKIAASGPRYCPTIEDKSVRFAANTDHQLFIEQTTINGDEIYPNGLFTGLPQDVQDKFLRTIKGFENVIVSSYGYAVEYLCADPINLLPTCAVKGIDGLYMGGQVMSTTGYEEAAALGLVAGINAASHALGKEPFVPQRTNSYLGVMLDDLTINGADEPYRMFTSRCEYRLSIRGDNADQRLTGTGIKMGVVGKSRADAFAKKMDDIAVGNKSDTHVRDYLCAREKYAPYMARQADEIDRIKQNENLVIPIWFDYSTVGGLSAELSEKLMVIRPHNIAAASRIRAMTPAGLLALIIKVKQLAR